MANRQTFFSQYRGRGGPAIDPGIIQMMGSIGDEYAKGITAIGKGIADARKAKEEQEKTEADFEALQKYFNNSETVVDQERFDRDKEIEDEMISGLELEASSKHSGFKTSAADLEDLNVINDYENIQKDKAFLQKELDDLVSANTKEEEILEVREDQLKSPEFWGPSKFLELDIPKKDPSKKPQSWWNAFRSDYESRKKGLPATAMESRQPAFLGLYRDDTELEKVISDKRKTITRNRENITAFEEQLNKLDTLGRMELENPGSTEGRARYTWNPDEKLIVHETRKSKITDERLLFYQGLEEEQGRLKTRQTPGGRTVPIGISRDTYRPTLLTGSGDMPTTRKKLAQSISEKVTDPDQLNRLLGYGRQPLKRQTAEKLEEYAVAQSVLDEARANRIDKQDYLRRLTERERLHKVVEGIQKGKNSLTLMDKIMEISKQIEEPKFHIATHPETGEKVVVLSNKYHVAKPSSVFGSPEQQAHAKQILARSDKARLEWATLEDDRDREVETLEKELLDLQSRNEEDAMDTLSNAEKKRMKDIPKIIEAKKQKHSRRFIKLMSDYPRVFGSQQIQTGVME